MHTVKYYDMKKKDKLESFKKMNVPEIILLLSKLRLAYILCSLSCIRNSKGKIQSRR